MPIDFDSQLRLQDLRLRILNDPDYHPSASEMREVLLDLQQGRERAAATAGGAKRRGGQSRTSEPVDLDALFGATHGTI
jgi:hypothetical protein